MTQGSPPAGQLLQTGKVVKVDLYVWCDRVDYRYVERGFLGLLPSGPEYKRWPRPVTLFGGRQGWEDEYEGINPAPRPCFGRNAYPGGWPGDGGDGGAVTSVLASAPIADHLCDLGAGQPGDPTESVAGAAPPGPTPAYALRIEIVLSTPVWESEREPSVAVQDISGRPGAPASGRHFEGTVPPASPVQYQTKRSAAKPGGNNNDGKPINLNETSLSWAHPAALAAVIAYARTAFRNGFREAAAALDPYYALAAGEAAKAADANLRLALAQVVTMRNNLMQNLDYYGNPPGWAPRLNALSNLEVLKTVRQAAYGTYYFADKMARDFNELEKQRDVSQRTSDVLGAELKVAGEVLLKAYKALPGALTALDAVQQQMVPVEDAIKDLRRRAEEKGIEKVKVQRIVSSALQLAGGIAQSLPVGQPFSGLAGSAFSAVGEFDWNAEDPLASAKGSLASLSSQVNAFVTDKNEKVVEALTRGGVESGGQQEALVAKLTRELEAEEKEPVEKEKLHLTTWKNFKNAERTLLATRIQDVTNAISEIKANNPNDTEGEAAVGNSFLAELQLQKAKIDALRAGRTGDTQQIYDLRKELVTYQQKLSEVEAQARRLARVKNAKLKKAAKEAEKDEERLAGLKQQLEAAKQRSQAHADSVAARKKTAGDVMSSLDMLGTGLSTMGNAVIKMVTPITADDPTVKHLADHMLADDPELREKGKALNVMLMDIMERKKKAAAELFRWQNEVSKATATISNNLGAMTELSRQRQSLDRGLDPSVLGYLKECRERAREALAVSIYWFVKSYQYEYLSDVEDSFYNFDSWTEKLRELEKTKQGATLTKDDFERIGNEVFEAECQNLGQRLLARRQKRGEKKSLAYPCVLERHAIPSGGQKLGEREIRDNELLDSLEKGEATFNFIKDFKIGSETFNDARVVDVVLTDFTVKSSDATLVLTIRIEQSGDLIIANNEPDEGKRVFYVFRPGRGDDPIYWEFAYAHSKRKLNTKGIDPSSTTGTKISENAKALFGAGGHEVKEYNPSLLSDYKVRLTDLYVNGVRKDLKVIDRVEMTATLVQGY